MSCGDQQPQEKRGESEKATRVGKFQVTIQPPSWSTDGIAGGWIVTKSSKFSNRVS